MSLSAHISVPPDPTMTVSDVTKVINKIEGNKMKVIRRLDVPESLLDEIEKSCSTVSEKNHAYADYYVHIHSDASWKHLTERLCEEGELTAARESKSHMSTGKCC